MEIAALRECGGHVFEGVDNDETASRIACLVKAKNLLIFTSTEGIYADPEDPSTLIRTISGKDAYELVANIEACKRYCAGASRAGANGAKAKLEYVKEAAAQGTTVYIASARYTIRAVLCGRSPLHQDLHRLTLPIFGTDRAARRPSGAAPHSLL